MTGPLAAAGAAAAAVAAVFFKGFLKFIEISLHNGRQHCKHDTQIDSCIYIYILADTTILLVGIVQTLHRKPLCFY